MQNIDLEEAVIGFILLDAAVLDRIPYLSAKDFSNKKCHVIFKTILEMKEVGEEIDLAFVFEKLHQKQFLVDAGGMDYLLEISGAEYSTDKAEHYAKALREKTIRRDVYKIARDFTAQIPKISGTDFDKSINEFQEKIFELTADSVSVDYQTSKEAVKDAMERVQELYDGKVSHLSTGYPELDKVISFGKSSFVIIAGRPSMGKTSLAMGIARNTAARATNVAIFSLETPNVDLVLRGLSAEAGVTTDALFRGELNECHFPKLMTACSKHSELPIFYFDVNNISVASMKTQCIKLKKELGLGLVVIDYLQLMQGKAENRTQEISALTRGIKNMGRDLGVPIICLSQLNRDLEKRADKRPQLSDLRGSGSIEQDADIIMFIYRACMYERDQRDNDVAEIIIAKNRNGSIGMVELLFEKQYTRFVSLAKKEDWR